MNSQRKQHITETTKRAITYWLKAQIAAGRTESEIKTAYALPETKEAIKASAKRLMN